MIPDSNAPRGRADHPHRSHSGMVGLFELRFGHVAAQHRWLEPDVKGQPLFAQAGVEGREAFQPALVLEPVLVDKVLDVAARHADIAEQAPGQGALAQPGAPRALHHLGKGAGARGVDLVLQRHHHRAFFGPGLHGRLAGRAARRRGEVEFGITLHRQAPRQQHTSTPKPAAASTAVRTLAHSAT
jgi:hypothetical protein